jgi:protein-tyrosine phosphatase
MKRILFLCTANYYRSRFAEALFNAEAARLGLIWQAESRGLDVAAFLNPGSLSAHTRRRLVELGIAVEGEPRFPCAVCEDDLTQADLVVALKEMEHRPLLAEQFPGWEERVEYWHVHDLDCATPEEALPWIEREIQALLTRLQEVASDHSCGPFSPKND